MRAEMATDMLNSSRPENEYEFRDARCRTPIEKHIAAG